jgi:hypothetical protein
MKPQDRLSGYMKPAKEGGVHFDVEGMAVDLITMCKAVGMLYAEFMENMGATWRAVEVEVKCLGDTKYHKPGRD